MMHVSESWSQAHPRSRGENRAWWSVAVEWQGSSPLTRGKPYQAFRRQPDNGLIPAHAGKTRVAIWRAIPARAHPRSRGENRRQAVPAPIFLGSSPLTRGKQGRGGCEGGEAGLIPAHAGKTRPGDRTMRQPRAHPRSRGENFVVANILDV